VLSCINARGENLPNFYIFKGKKKSINFLSKTGKKEVVLAMQKKVWITHELFREWLLHFPLNVENFMALAHPIATLLILDGHSSHVTLEVIKLAMSKGLDMLTFPSHISHALQPLDISCFRSFKLYFRAYRDK